MRRAVCLELTLLCSVLGVSPALAHPGDHARFDWRALAGHLLEPDHLAFIALIVVVGLLAFSVGRRVERRVRDRGVR